MKVYVEMTSRRPTQDTVKNTISYINPASSDEDLGELVANVAQLSLNTLTNAQKVVVTELPINVPIDNVANYKLISGTPLDNTITSSGVGVTIDAQDGNDLVRNSGSDTKIYLGGGDDTLENEADNVTIEGGGGEDFIESVGDNVSIVG